MPDGLRIGIDLTALLPDATGVDVYLLNLVEQLGAVDCHNAYFVCINAEDRRRLAPLARPNVRLVPIAARPRPARLFAQQVVLPVWSALRSLDVLHSPSFICPLWSGHTRHVLTIHDMTSFSRPDQHIALRGSNVYRAAVRRSIRRADLVIVPSRHTQRTVYEHLPGLPRDHVHVVANGVGEPFRPVARKTCEDTARRLGLPKHYVLAVGTIEPRKNLGRVLSAYRRVAERDAIAEDLVLCGRLGWKYHDVLEQLRAPPLRGRVHQIGYVADADLPALYSQASAFLYPSLEEGFGFPPLEAMACGVPTISSDSSALDENLRGAAVLVDPTSSDDIAAALARVLADADLRRELSARGRERASQFRWSETATQTVALYETAASPAVER